MRRFSESDRSHVFWWSPPRSRLRLRRRENAGDYLSPVLIERLLSRAGLRISDKRSDTGRLLAVGSILHFARDGDVIWGSGVNGKIPAARHRFDRLDVRAVRGPRTRAFLLDRDIPCPEVYGDPALLLPHLFPELTDQRTAVRDYLVIPHMHDTDATALRAVRVDTRRILRPTTHWKRFLRTIIASRFVLSASLHGLIVAEAFGVPARMLRLSSREALFKYADYYEGTGRSTFTPATSVSEGLALGPEPKPTFDAQALLDAFPIDLWV